VARTILACTTAIALAPESVARAGAPCARVVASADLAGPWIDAVHELERQLALLPASDCQAVTLKIERGVGAAVRVVGTTVDGRRAERAISSPASLVATGLGLVMAIPGSPEPPLAPAATAAPAPVGAAGPVAALAATPLVDRSPDPVEASVAPAPRLHLWLGFEAGGRSALPATVAAADVAVHGDILLGHWLFTVVVRDSVVGFAPAQGFDNDAFREVNVALGVGRRVDAGEASFDLILAPALSAMRLEWDFPGDREAAGEDVELSVNALARVALSLSKNWALTLTLESELVPGNLTTSPGRIEVPAGVPANAALPPDFPAWTGGFRIGAMGALL
jgi:hypothetical protein